MAITDETQFKIFYEEYKSYNANLEKNIIQTGLDINKFKKHLAEAYMAGYAFGYVEGEFFGKGVASNE